MRKRYSSISCLFICIIYISVRLIYSDAEKRANMKVTTWDALGYYMYLPATIIYHDIKKLEWFPAIDSQYHLSGGELYQALKHENGNYYFKYLGGVSILQLPFFTIAHIYTENSSHYQADGFSPPYQYAIAFGSLLYFIVALFLLRAFLRIYFSDKITASALLLLTLATNLIQYVSIDGGMSHGYIFPLYVFILWASYKWHKKTSLFWAGCMGYVIGLATISRPTEAVMLFIPLLWNTHTQAAARQKWETVKAHKSHIAFAIFFGFIGIFPQLIYWKTVTGSWVCDVGSKWTFLNPFFRVLFGWEKGWFIYTPVTLFFVTGLFFVKKYPFKNSVIWFCMLNIYIIISWFDWRYGASYSTRALSQSYAVFSLPLAAFLSSVKKRAYRILAFVLGAYLIAVNLFQVYQYNEEILHYNDMNRKYYAHIYLNARPTPLDMSLLDTDEFLDDEQKHTAIISVQKTTLPLNLSAYETQSIIDTILTLEKNDWIKVDATFFVEQGLWNSKLVAEMDGEKRFFRMDNALSKEGQINRYTFYERIDSNADAATFKLSIQAGSYFKGSAQKVTIIVLRQKNDNAIF